MKDDYIFVKNQNDYQFNSNNVVDILHQLGRKCETIEHHPIYKTDKISYSKGSIRNYEIHLNIDVRGITYQGLIKINLCNNNMFNFNDTYDIFHELSSRYKNIEYLGDFK